MRFFEYKAGEIVKRAGIPVSDFGFATGADAAREIAERIGGPTVVKSQVLTGGRMKAGGVKFADSPAEAAHHAEDILRLENNGHMPRGVLVDPRAEIKQEYYAGVVWDGLHQRPVMTFPAGWRDRHRGGRRRAAGQVGRRHFSTLQPFREFAAKEVIASTGRTGPPLDAHHTHPRSARQAPPGGRHDARRDGAVQIVEENLDECLLCRLCLDASVPGR